MPLCGVICTNRNGKSPWPQAFRQPVIIAGKSVWYSLPARRIRFALIPDGAANRVRLQWRDRAVVEPLGRFTFCRGILRAAAACEAAALPAALAFARASLRTCFKQLRFTLLVVLQHSSGTRPSARLVDRASGLSVGLHFEIRLRSPCLGHSAADCRLDQAHWHAQLLLAILCRRNTPRAEKPRADCGESTAQVPQCDSCGSSTARLAANSRNCASPAAAIALLPPFERLESKPMFDWPLQIQTSPTSTSFLHRLGAAPPSRSACGLRPRLRAGRASRTTCPPRRRSPCSPGRRIARRLSCPAPQYPTPARPSRAARPHGP